MSYKDLERVGAHVRIRQDSEYAYQHNGVGTVTYIEGGG